MKRILLGTLFTVVSLNAMAEAPGGPNCGWGNMLFEGQRGTPAHFLASTTNGTSGNATFGMTSGTNGCSTKASLTYGGKSWFAMNGMMNELSEDMAMGQGEALTTYAVVLGVAPEDRSYFNSVTHQHFNQIDLQQRRRHCRNCPQQHPGRSEERPTPGQIRYRGLSTAAPAPPGAGFAFFGIVKK